MLGRARRARFLVRRWRIVGDPPSQVGGRAKRRCAATGPGAHHTPHPLAEGCAHSDESERESRSGHSVIYRGNPSRGRPCKIVGMQDSSEPLAKAWRARRVRQRASRLWRSTLFVLDSDVAREAIRHGVRRTTLYSLDRYATVMGLARTLFRASFGVLLIPLAFKTINSLDPTADLNADIVPRLINFIAVIGMGISGGVLVSFRYRPSGVKLRSATRIVACLNSIRRTVRNPDDNRDECDGPLPSTLSNWASATRECREHLHKVAWQISYDIAELAGRRSRERIDEQWSRLSRVIHWVAEKPWNRTRRRTLMKACELYADRLLTVNMLDPLPIEVPDYLVTPPRLKRSLQPLLDLVRDRSFWVGLTVGLLVLFVEKGLDIVVKGIDFLVK